MPPAPAPARPDLEALLAEHWSACYRAALGLTGQPHTAEDVTQEAFVDALRALDTFDPERPLRPWLLGILHRRALKHHRTRRRRDAREERAARRDAAHDPSERAGEGEEAALVREHLQRIRPEFRHALALRYLEGLSLAEVAEALGVPQGTVSSRIRRGLRDLERSLQPVLGASGAALLAFLGQSVAEAAVPPAPSAGALAARGSLAPTGGGATSAARARRVAALLAAVAAGLLATLLAAVVLDASPADPAVGAAPPSAGAPEPEGEGPAGDDGAARGADAGAGGAPAPDEGPAAPPAAKPATIRGRLRAPRLEDAWVAAVDRDLLARLLGPVFGGADVPAARRLLGRAGFGWNRPAGSQPLGEDGAFALDLPPGEHLLALGAHGCRTRLLTVTAPRAEPLDVTLAWLDPSPLELEVVDEAGRPYASCRAVLRSDALEARVWVDGLDAWAEALPRGQRLARALRAWPLEPVALDREGRARLTWPAGAYPDLEVEPRPATRRVEGSIWPFMARSLTPARAAVELAPDALAPARVVADWRWGTYAGRQTVVDVEVVDPRGAPVPGAWVQVIEHPSPEGSIDGLRVDGQLSSSWTTDAAGRVRLYGLPAGQDLHVAAREGDRWTGLDQVLRLEETPPDDVGCRVRRLVLDQPFAAGRLRLVLRDAASGEAPGSSGLATVGAGTLSFAAAWSVYLAPLDGQPEVGQGWRHEAPGVLVFDDLPPGRWQVRVDQPAGPREVSYLPGEGEVALEAGATAELTLALSRGATLAGALQRDGAPLPPELAGRASLSLYDAETHRSPGSVQLDAAGRFVASGLDPDRRYLLVVHSIPGYLPLVVRDLEPRAEPHAIELPGDEGLEVLVRGADGRPLRGARVAWRGRGLADGEAETDAAGTAAWRGRIPGEVTVQVWAEGHLAQERAVAGPGPERLEVRLAPDPAGGHVRGRVVDAEGLPLPGVRVDASSGVTVDETDADGRFSVRLGGGSRRLFFARADCLTGRVDLEIAPGDERTVEVTLTRGSRIQGRLDAPPARLARLRVLVQPEGVDDRERLGLDAESGAFTTRSALPAGRYTLEVWDRDAERVVVARSLVLVAGRDVIGLELAVE